MTPTPASLDLAPDRQLRDQRPGRQARRASSGAACRASTAIPIFHALLDSERAACPRRRAERRARRLRRAPSRPTTPGTAVLRTRLFDPRARASRSSTSAPRFFNRDRTFRPAQLVRRVRPLVGPPAHALRACARAANGARATPEITRGSNHLRFVLPEQHAAPEHQRAAHLRARRHLVLARRADEPAPRPRRDAVRRHRGDRARLRGADRRCTGATGRAAWPCRWSGRTR